MKTVVIKLSGSLFTFDNGISNIEKIIKTLEEITINPYNFRVVAVAGGGKLARTIQDVSRSFNADEAFLDQLGIDISRVHAKLLTTCTTNSYHSVPQTLDEVIHSISSSKLVFSGGLSPGQSTNATAALIAERTKAELFINTTDVAGVFTSDPRKDNTAKLVESITIHDLLSKIIGDKMNAGTYDLMDLLSLKIIERSKIPTVITKCDSECIKSVISGNSTGTKITF